MNEMKKALLPGLAAMLLMLPHAFAQGPGEYEVKAAFIHNIVKFVEWPALPTGDNYLRLCILGQDPFGNALAVLNGKQIGKQTWTISVASAQSDLKECRVLFIAASEARNLGRIREKTKGATVLTLGDSEGYAEQGVMVNFYMEDNRVRFEINPEAAGRAHLKFSSQLLKLARIAGTRGAP